MNVKTEGNNEPPVKKQRRAGRLQNRITLLILGVLVPLLGLYTYVNIQNQRQSMEELRLEKAQSIASSGAYTIGLQLQQAIESGQLSKEDVFDTNYEEFWGYDAASYPDFEGEPQSLNKYHTAYDAYTDANWQGFVDTLLTTEDIIFAIPVDKNGYLPTHNTRWSSWDGSPATDRSKRIFNDPVGIAAAQNTEAVLQQIYPRPGTGETLWDVSVPIFVDGEHWGAFRVGMELTQNQARVNRATIQAIVLLFVLLFIMVVLAWLIGRYIANPIKRLTTAAVQVAGGDLEQRVDIPKRDEITDLADAFNQMTADLKKNLGQIERRNQTLQTNMEVSRRLSTILNQKQLVSEVVEQIRAAFNYYHVHIYLLEADGDLVMVSGSGEVGKTLLNQGHRILKGRGLIGRAAETREIVLVADVAQDKEWLPNPLLPETKSEIAAPLMAGETLVGVLDVQQDETNGLTEEDAWLLQAVANQVAVALDNARLFEQAQNQAERETVINTIAQKIQSASDIEMVLQIASQELGKAIGVQRTSVFLGQDRTKGANGQKMREEG